MSDKNAVAENDYDDSEYFASLTGVKDEPEAVEPEPAEVAEEATEATEETEQPEAEQAEKPEEADETQAEIDWRKRAEEYEKRALELEHRLKSDDGRVSAYQRQIDELNAKLKASPKPEIESLQQLKADYPDIAKAIDDRINEAKAEIESRLTPLQKMQEEQAETYRRNQFQESVNALSAQHPDWQQYDRDSNQEFASWLDTQPSGIRAMYGAPEDTAANAAALISLYKQSHANQSQDAAASSAGSQSKQARLQRAVIPTTRNGSVSRETGTDLSWEQAVRKAQKHLT